MADTINIGGLDVELALLKYTRNVSKPNPEKPGKKHLVPEEDGYIGPVLNNATEYTAFFAALLKGAEEQAEGNANKLAHRILFPQLLAASDAGFDLETGTEDTKAYVATLLSPETSRSGGLTKEKINEQLGAVAPELAQLSVVAAKKDGWRDLKDDAGTPLFKTQEEYLLRLMHLQTTINNLLALSAAQAKKSAAAKAKREENAAKAKAEAAKAAATAAAAPAAPAPVNA